MASIQEMWGGCPLGAASGCVGHRVDGIASAASGAVMQWGFSGCPVMVFLPSAPLDGILSGEPEGSKLAERGPLGTGP